MKKNRKMRIKRLDRFIQTLLMKGFTFKLLFLNQNLNSNFLNTLTFKLPQ